MLIICFLCRSFCLSCSAVDMGVSELTVIRKLLDGGATYDAIVRASVDATLHERESLAAMRQRLSTVAAPPPPPPTIPPSLQHMARKLLDAGHSLDDIAAAFKDRPLARVDVVNRGEPVCFDFGWMELIIGWLPLLMYVTADRHTYYYFAPSRPRCLLSPPFSSSLSLRPSDVTGYELRVIRNLMKIFSNVRILKALNNQQAQPQGRSNWLDYDFMYSIIDR